MRAFSLRPHLVAGLAAAGLLAAGSVAAQSFEDRVAARQGQFKLFALHVGPLVGMAQGNIEYDAALAQTAADNLVRLTSVEQTLLWPEGSDNVSIDGTRALPAIWEDLEDFAAKMDDLRAGTEAMQAVAGDGLDAVRGALGGVGGACQACHEAYRGPAD